jgi:hypothetical protein
MGKTTEKNEKKHMAIIGQKILGRVTMSRMWQTRDHK